MPPNTENMRSPYGPVPKYSSKQSPAYTQRPMVTKIVSPAPLATAALRSGFQSSCFFRFPSIKVPFKPGTSRSKSLQAAFLLYAKGVFARTSPTLTKPILIHCNIGTGAALYFLDNFHLFTINLSERSCPQRILSTILWDASPSPYGFTASAIFRYAASSVKSS